MGAGGPIQRRARVVGGAAAAGLGVSIPISTSLDGLLLVVVALAWAVSGLAKHSWNMVRGNPVVAALPLFFILLALGTLYGVAPFAERLKYLAKYDDLLFPVVLAPLFADASVRRLGLLAFGASMALTLVLSILVALGWMPAISWIHGWPGNATVFKHKVTHNLLMAVAVLVFASGAIGQTVPWKRWGLAALTVGAIIDVFMLVPGRTGQVVLSVFIVFWCWRRLAWRGLFLGILVAGGAIATSYYASSSFQDRVLLAIEEAEQAQVQDVAPGSSSVGLRLEWYRKTLGLMAQHPWMGVGTGSFAREYAAIVTDPEALRPAHPHNQYLLTGAELGLPGLLMLVMLFVVLGRKALQAGADDLGELAQGLVMLMVIGCFFNSLLLDHTEGLFFVWGLSLTMMWWAETGCCGST